MCIEMTMIRISTDEQTDSMPAGSFRIFTFGLDSRCKEEQKEKYERYARLEAHLQLLKKIKEETADTIQKALDDKPRVNIYQPFILWYALENYDMISYQEISIEIKNKKRIENRTEKKDMYISELDEEKQRIFTDAKNKVKENIIRYLSELKQAVEKVLENETRKEKEKEIEEKMNMLLEKYQKMQDMLIERLAEYERRQKQYEQEIEHMKMMIEREIAFQMELAEKGIIQRVKAQLNDMKETLIREKNRLVMAYQSAKERIKGIFKRKDRHKDIDREQNREQNRDNDRGLEL